MAKYSCLAYEGKFYSEIMRDLETPPMLANEVVAELNRLTDRVQELEVMMEEQTADALKAVAMAKEAREVARAWARQARDPDDARTLPIPEWLTTEGGA